MSRRTARGPAAAGGPRPPVAGVVQPARSGRLRRAAWLALAAGLALAAAAVPPAAVATEPAAWVTVANGLRGPRGVTIAPDGRVLVAEAGTGGDACADLPTGGRACAGMTGAVTAIGAGGQVRIVDGLPSARAADGRIVGPAEVAVRPDGTLLVVIGSPGDAAVRAALPAEAAALLGTVVTIPADGGAPVVLADLLAWETENDPDRADAHADRAADPAAAALLPDGTLVVADAAANSVLRVAPDGAVALVAHVPPFGYPVMGAPMDGGDPRAPTLPPGVAGIVPLRAAPASIALGPDGALLVGLRTSDPSLAGAARVERLAPGARPAPWAEGFTGVADVALAADGTLLVLARGHRSGPGNVWAVPPGGGAPAARPTLPLAAPAGIAVDGAGTLLVTDAGSGPEDGRLLLLRP